MNTNQKKVLFIGLTTIDIQYFTDRFPLPNTKHKTEAPIITVGGPAANAAITFSVMGGQADFLTCIGKHSFTQVIYDDFSKYGVKVIDQRAGIETDPIVSAVITNLTNSERTIITHHPVETKSDLSYKISVADYDLVFIDGFYPELSIDIQKDARKLRIPVVFDGGSWKSHLPNLLNLVDIAICSGNFQPPLCKTDTDVFTYLKSFGIKETAMSKGEESIVGEGFIVKIEKVNAIDSLGAGDILHGAFCWYWLKTFDFKIALEKASWVATFSVQFKGTHSWIDYRSTLDSI